MSEDTSSETFFRRSRISQDLGSSQKPKFSFSKRTIFITTGIFILVWLVIFAGFSSNGKNEIESPHTQTVPTISSPTEIPTPTDEPTPTIGYTPTPEPSPSKSLTPSPKKSLTPTKSPANMKTTDVDRSGLTIAIQNGSGVAGAATKASDILKDLGYEISTTGNADNFEYEKTIIQVKSTKKAYLEQLKTDLESEYTIGQATADLTGSSADALIIIGKN